MGVRGAPGVPETLQKGGGEGPPPSELAPEAPGAGRTPKMTDFRPRGPLKGPRGPLKGPRGPLKGPRSPLKGPRGPLKGAPEISPAPRMALGGAPAAILTLPNGLKAISRRFPAETSGHFFKPLLNPF